MDTKPRRKGKVAGDKSAIVAALPLACVDENAAVDFLERQRWGDTPCCPRCGDTAVRKMLDKNGNRNKRFLWRCHGCKKQFTVRIGAVYEESRIPLRFWCYAFWASCASKKGVSALQVKRQTGLNYRSALYLLNRIRYAMDHHNDPDSRKLTGVVEADEVYLGGLSKWKHPADIKGTKQRGIKTPVFAVVERGGELRARVMPTVTSANLVDALRKYVSPDAHLMTDDNRPYRGVGRPFARHGIIQHCLGEYVRRDDPDIGTNTIESFWTLLRRKLHGTHHSVSPAYLHRYVAEAAFVFNNRAVDDGERVVRAIRAANGKRLMYRESKRKGVA